MSDIDDVLERLLTDAEFKAALGHDTAGALAGYSLTEDDLELLSAQVSADSGADSGVEQRISKAGLAGLMSFGNVAHHIPEQTHTPTLMEIHGFNPQPDIPGMPVEVPPVTPE